MPHITSAQNPLVKHLVKLRKDKDYRYAQQSLILEGIKPVKEVIPFIKKIIRAESASIDLSLEAEEWIVTDAIFAKISGMISPEGILAEVQMPSWSTLNGLQWIVALDGINDPGNLGTLLRTALALGWQGVYILSNSCDPFNEKAVRAARGAHFRLPLAFGTQKSLVNLIEQNKLEPVVADIKGTAIELYPSTETGTLLVLGNEAHGASPEMQRICSKVKIPMQGEMESLNVAIAGSILMYTLRNR